MTSTGSRSPAALDETNGTPANGTFTLQEIGPGGDVSDMTGARDRAESEAEGVTGFLRPEDCAWDPDNPNMLYFITTNSFTGNSRLYKLTFADIANPQLGGTIEAVLDGTEGSTKMFDNMTVAGGKVILQEDPGNGYMAKIWEYDIASDTLDAVAAFDPALFTPGGPASSPRTRKARASIDVTAMLGDADTQRLSARRADPRPDRRPGDRRARPAAGRCTSTTRSDRRQWR